MVYNKDLPLIIVDKIVLVFEEAGWQSAVQDVRQRVVDPHQHEILLAGCLWSNGGGCRNPVSNAHHDRLLY